MKRLAFVPPARSNLQARFWLALLTNDTWELGRLEYDFAYARLKQEEHWRLVNQSWESSEL